jgi:hypothetical protein
VTCLKDAQVSGRVTVGAGASLVASNSSINGGLTADGAAVVQMFGTTVNGQTQISGTTGNVIAAGSTFNGRFDLSGTTAGERGLILTGNGINGRLKCDRNTPDVTDFGAKNNVNGHKTGQCQEM